MVIGFDASRAFVKERTGTENYSFELLKAISKTDIQNSYLIYLRPGQNPGKDWPENFKFKLINFPRLWTQLGLALQTFTDSLDVLFIPAHTLPLIRKPGLKTVITVHDLGAEYLPGFHQLKQILYLKLMTHYQLKSASKIIAVSEATKKDLIKSIEINSGKIEVIYEGVSDEFMIQASKLKDDTLRDVLRRFSIEKGKYFLFVGTIQPRKNLERLIKAFALLESSDYKLVLVGQKGWKSDDIYELPKKLGIAEQVRFLGRVFEQELIVLYKGAIALTYPSLFEGFGLPILEAFACGCPVITSNSSSMPEVAGNAAILVDAVNEKEISEAMVKLIRNDDLRNNLIQKGYSRLKNFSWKKSAQSTLKILENVLEGKESEK